jgi:Glycosyltransferase like family
VIAFGAAITEEDPYRLHAEPGIVRAAEADSEVYAYAKVEPVGRTYNLILDAAAGRDELEALVLVHPHTEITDPQLCEKVRQALSDPEVAVVGAAGATGVRSIAWWDGDVVSAPLIRHYEEFAGGEMHAFAWAPRRLPPAEVETVDGQLFALSPWAVRNVRFDEALILGHGFDLDYCLQVRAAGRKAVVADLRATHHRSIELVRDLDVFVEAHVDVADKWDHVLYGPMPDDEASWKRRARRAEADREAARAVAFSKSMARDAQVLALERVLAETTDSLSWRITEPLRELNQLRRQARERRRKRRAR